MKKLADVIKPTGRHAAARAWIVSIGIVAGVAAAGCKHDAAAPREGVGPAQDPAAGWPKEGMPSARGPASGAAASMSAMSGTVAETMKSGGYTYARVSVRGQDVWAAGPETTLAVGAPVDLSGGALMTDFHSDTLDRTFDQIYFLSAWSGGAGDAAPSFGGDPGGMAAGSASPHGAPAASALAPGETLAPVDGGPTIAQVFAGKADLAGKPIAIHGKVVKVNGGIMGKNWLHLQDGSGSAGSNDLIVTSQDSANVGDVIVARGTIAVDKDLGAGYRYDVLLEDATLGRP